MLAHGHNFRDNGVARPFNSEHFRKLFEILGCSFSYREDSITEPAHTQLT